MPIYSYQGKQYKLAETDPSKALERIKAFSNAPTPEDWIDHAANAAPALLGAAGGIGGTTLGATFGLGFGGIPAGVGGAMAGGLAGAKLRDAIERARGRPISGEPATKAALEQGAYQLSGVGLAKTAAIGAKIVGKPAMAWLMRSTPEVAQTLINEGIVVSRRGLVKLMNKIGLAGKETRSIATSSPQTFDSRSVAKKVVDQLLPDIEGQAIAGPDKRLMMRLTNQFLKDHPGPMSASELLVIKQKSDRVASPIFKSVERGDPVSSVLQMKARWHKAMYDHAKELLNGTQDPMTGQWAGGIPGMGDANQYTESLLKAKQALRPLVKSGRSFASQITRRSLPVLAGGTLGAMSPAEDYQSRMLHGATGATLGALLSSPDAVSHIIQMLRSPAVAASLRQAPRIGGALVGNQ